jgi:hypothetical protein
MLARLYEAIWQRTTQEPWTYIMRRNPLLLLVPATALVLALAIRLSFTWKGRVVLALTVGGIAFLAGHVFWGTTTRCLGCP